MQAPGAITSGQLAVCGNMTPLGCKGMGGAASAAAVRSNAGDELQLQFASFQTDQMSDAESLGVSDGEGHHDLGHRQLVGSEVIGDHAGGRPDDSHKFQFCYRQSLSAKTASELPKCALLLLCVVRDQA